MENPNKQGILQKIESLIPFIENFLNFRDSFKTHESSLEFLWDFLLKKGRNRNLKNSMNFYHFCNYFYKVQKLLI